MRSRILYYLFCLLILLLFQCIQNENLIIQHQVTGPVDANCYLVYGDKTKEAVLIDVGGTVDTLLQIIQSNELDLKYIFFTHGHFDHVMGLPAIRVKFPQAKVGIHKDDYEDHKQQYQQYTNCRFKHRHI